MKRETVAQEALRRGEIRMVRAVCTNEVLFFFGVISTGAVFQAKGEISRANEILRDGESLSVEKRAHWNDEEQFRIQSVKKLVVGEGAAPSRHANLAFSRVYKAPLHGWCYPPWCGVVL
jgi:phosphatidylserine decarboxylase